MLAKIEFFYWEDCPSHERALALLREVMSEEGIDAPVEVIRVDSGDDAEHYNFFGSPTIHVNGKDIAGFPDDLAGPSLTCRTYRRADGRFTPLPPRELIVQALRDAAP